MNVASIAVVALAQAVADPGAVRARETAYARIPLAERIASDPEILRAIKAKNASGETESEIQRKDQEWRANPRYVGSPSSWPRATRSSVRSL